jgi:hypothetical protein
MTRRRFPSGVLPAAAGFVAVSLSRRQGLPIDARTALQVATPRSERVPVSSGSAQ